MSTRVPFSLIWYPGTRAVAYLNVLRDLNRKPDVIVTLNNARDITKNERFQEQLKALNPGYDVSYQLEAYIAEYPTPVIHSVAHSINDFALQNILQDHGTKTWLFTGGGILKPDLFNFGARYLHIHPGRLPQFRGSTCFYYSLLKNNSLSASAFFLRPELDSGEVICERSFRIRIPEQAPPALYMDHIVDPWIRSQTLKSTLQTNFERNSTPPKPQHTPRPYYVMHPVLRAATVMQQQTRSRNLPCGVTDYE